MSQKRYPLLILLLAAAAAVIAAGYFTVPRHEETEEIKTREELAVKSELSYEVEAGEDTALWEAGELIEDKPLYFYGIEPAVRVYPSFSPGRTLEGQVDIDLELLSLSGDEERYWSKNLESRQQEIVLDEEKQLEPLEFNPEDIRDHAEEISTEIEDGAGDYQVLLAVRAEFEGKALSQDIFFELEGSGVVPPDEALVAEEMYTEEYTETVTRERELLDYFVCNYFWGFAGSLFGLAVLVLFLSAGGHKDEYQKYDGLVSKGYLSLDKKEPDVQFITLKELIELAAELDKKVVYDPVKGIYFVIDGDNLYVHEKKSEEHGLQDYSHQRGVNR